MIYGLIIAKGSSSRIPGKNLRSFCGRPLLAWTLMQMAQSHIDETIVSTDSQEVADVCREYGATPYMRTHAEESVGNTSGGVPMYFLRKWVFEHRPDIEIVVDGFCTSPLRLPGDIDKCIAICRDTGLLTTPLCKRYDTFIELVVGENRRTPFIADKSFSYADCQPGLSVIPAEQIIQQLEVTDELYTGEWWKKEVNEESLRERSRFKLPNVDMRTVPLYPFHEVEPWQIVEIDHLWQFRVAELLMREYILNPLGENCYEN